MVIRYLYLPDTVLIQGIAGMNTLLMLFLSGLSYNGSVQKQYLSVCIFR